MFDYSISKTNDNQKEKKNPHLNAKKVKNHM